MSQMIAIYHVIRNRAEDTRAFWPNNLAEVVTQPFQFSSFNSGDPNSTLFPKKSNKADWDAWIKCESVVTATLSADPTDGANSYHSIPDSGYDYKDKNGVEHHLTPPAWATADKFKLQLGPLRFYKV